MRETNLGHKKRVELNATKLLENFPSSLDKLRCDLADVDNIVDVLIKTNTKQTWTLTFRWTQTLLTESRN